MVDRRRTGRGIDEDSSFVVVLMDRRQKLIVHRAAAHISIQSVFLAVSITDLCPGLSFPDQGRVIIVYVGVGRSDPRGKAIATSPGTPN